MPSPGIPKNKGHKQAFHGSIHRGVRGRASARGVKSTNSPRGGLSSEEAIAVESDSEAQGVESCVEHPQESPVAELEQQPSTTSTIPSATTSTATTTEKPLTETEQVEQSKQSKHAEHAEKEKRIETEIVSRIDLPGKSTASVPADKGAQRDASPQKGRHTVTAPLQSPGVRETRSASRKKARRKELKCIQE